MDSGRKKVLVEKYSGKIAVAFIVCFWLLLYGQATGFGFVWDDKHYLLSYGWYLQEDFLVKAFTTASYLDNYYRPLGVALIHSELRWLSAPHLASCRQSVGSLVEWTAGLFHHQYTHK
ncbi:hypothetical protein [Thiolapillus sp.]